MVYNSKAKLKILHIWRILEEETDAAHGLSMRQIIERLNELGIPSERKSIYRDIETLREFGLDIRTYQRNPVEYAIERRDFDFNELTLLIDAVESCKALTRHQANALTTNLRLMASDHQRELLNRRIHVSGRIKSKKESVFKEINEIHQAIHKKRKIEFKYYHIDINGKRCASHNGEPYVVTPVAITYDEGFYYLTSWNDDENDLYEFRIDRMGSVKISDAKATRNQAILNYSFDDNSRECFGRFNGEPITVTLDVHEEKIEIILDRFGDTAKISPAGNQNAHAVVRVRKSPQFFGWIAGMDGAVRINKPARVKKEYQEYLKRLIDA